MNRSIRLSFWQKLQLTYLYSKLEMERIKLFRFWFKYQNQIFLPNLFTILFFNSDLN